MTIRSINERFKSHIRESLNQKYNMYLHNAIRKHSKECFEISLIEICDDNIAAEREKYWIKELNTIQPYGYNEHEGGNGGCPNPSDELRKKLSLAKMGNVPWNKGMNKTDMEKYKNRPPKPLLTKIKKEKIKKESIKKGHTDRVYTKRYNQTEILIKHCELLSCNKLFVSKKSKERRFCSKSCRCSNNAKFVKINGMKKTEVREKFSKKITGRKKKFNEDGSWSWYYPNKVGPLVNKVEPIPQTKYP